MALTKEEEKIKLGIQRALKSMDAANYQLDEYKRFSHLKDAIEIATEYTPKEFIKTFLKSQGHDNNIFRQVRLVKIVRHTLAHFPIFSSADEIFFDYDMMLNKTGMSQICEFFQEADGSNFNIKVKGYDGSYCECKCKSQYMGPGERIYLKDMFIFKSAQYYRDKNNTLGIIAILAMTFFEEYIRSNKELNKKMDVNRHPSISHTYAQDYTPTL